MRTFGSEVSATDIASGATRRVTTGRDGRFRFSALAAGRYTLLAEALGIDRDTFMNIALQQQSWGPTFSMTVLALRLSAYHNGVSELHGAVARQMWLRARMFVTEAGTVHSALDEASGQLLPFAEVNLCGLARTRHLQPFWCSHHVAMV